VTSPGTSEQRLSGQDLSFLAWESAARPMHIALRADFRCPPGQDAPTIDELRGVIAERIREEPRLRRRLRRRWLRRAVWEEPGEIAIERHVTWAAPPGELRADRRALLDECLGAPLDPSIPPWEIRLLPAGADPRVFTLAVKVHHVLIDGMAGVALLERLLGAAPAPTPQRARPATPRRRRPLSLRAMLRFVRSQFAGEPRTPLHGDVGPRRHHELEQDAEAFDAAAARLGGTRNDLILATVSGAIGRWLSRRSAGAAPASLRAFCPVSLRAPGDGTGFGNQIAPWLVPLPIVEPDLAVRVAQVRATTRAMKRSGAQRGGDGMARVIEWLGPWVAKLGMTIAARRRAWGIVVTNVRGPRSVDLLGARLTRLVAFAPLFPGQRVSIAVVGCEGRLFWGVCEGWRAPELGADFAGELGAELDALAEHRDASGEAA
jgi:hypothetical protein